jgi:hypothetical protein
VAVPLQILQAMSSLPLLLLLLLLLLPGSCCCCGQQY